MKYIIMLLIVIGMAASDILTGFLKGCITDGRPSSQKMRIGGLHKIAEITVKLTACGLEYGIERLGELCEAPQLAELAGTLTAVSVFCYIVIMEVVSILENYAQIDPNAKWVKNFSDKFKGGKHD